MGKFKLQLSLCLSIVLLMSVNHVTAQKVKKTIDWNNYPTWENATVYSKTYVVNQRHPNASDKNPGTTEKPLRTINEAAQRVKAGERVLIYSGVYREMIQPKSGGDSADKMISYESAPGETVIIKGSRILKSEWIQRKVLTDVLPDPSLTYTWSRKIWLTELPDELFEEDYFPFQLPNILPEEHKLMPWAKLMKNLAPYTSTRGMIFQNGKRMLQLESYGDLARVPGSFWVDDDGKTVHIHGFDGQNPNGDLFEVGVQSHLFRPQLVGLGYIQVQGLTFEHCANGFLRTSTGAVTTKGGHHWIIQQNAIRQVNSSGLEFGYLAFERKDPNPLNLQPRTDPDIGGVIVRGNRISQCGTAGIRSHTVRDAHIENNHIWQCGWQDAENYWECSGIKILRARNTLVRGNHIHHIQGGNGIWLDWDNQYSRVTGNIIHDVQTIQGGIFIEASQTPNLVDNNFIWNIDGNGVFGNDTDELLICHNLIAKTTGAPVHAIVSTQRKLNDRWLTADRNSLFNNLIIDGGMPLKLSGKGNVQEGNLFVSTRGVVDNADEKPLSALVSYDPANQQFTWEAEKTLPPVSVVKLNLGDWFRQVRDGESTFPGPFQHLNEHGRVMLQGN